jgi:hypothetical protein
MKATFLLCLLFAGYILCETDSTRDIKAVRGVFEVQADRHIILCKQLISLNRQLGSVLGHVELRSPKEHQ